MGDEDEGSKPTKSFSKAKERLAQVQHHVAPEMSDTFKRRRRRTKDDELPADYSDIMGQIATLRKIAATPDPQNRGYQRQKKAGKLWVRERVDAMLDPGSFKEVGSVSGTVKWKKVGEAKEAPVECMSLLKPDLRQLKADHKLIQIFLRTMCKDLANFTVDQSSSQQTISRYELGMQTAP
jgi:hypothetical protein